MALTHEKIEKSPTLLIVLTLQSVTLAGLVAASNAAQLDVLARIGRLTAPGVRPSSSAARVTEPMRAVASKARRAERGGSWRICELSSPI